MGKWALTSVHVEDVAGRTDPNRRPAAGLVEQSLLELLEQNVLCSFATVTPEGRPHINTAYFSYTNDVTLYFLSYPSSLHSRNLATNGLMAAAVFSSLQQWTEPGWGVQLFGWCAPVEGGDVEPAERSYAGRFRGYAGWREALEGHAPGRLYQFYGFKALELKIMDEKRLGDAVFVRAAVRRD